LIFGLIVYIAALPLSLIAEIAIMTVTPEDLIAANKLLNESDLKHLVKLKSEAERKTVSEMSNEDFFKSLNLPLKLHGHRSSKP
jgi:hypothetical protein